MRKGEIIALISVDDFSARSYLEKLASSQGFKVVELNVIEESIPRLRAKLLQRDLFSSGTLYVLKGFSDRKLKSSDELVRVLKGASEAGKTVIIWLVSDRWIFKADYLGEELYAFLSSKEVRRVFLETPRRRKSYLEKAIQLSAELGLQLPEDLLVRIVERFQGDMDEVGAFLRKLSSSGLIDPGSVEELLTSEESGSKLDNLAFLNALMNKEWDRLLRSLRAYRRANSDLTSLVYLISSQFVIAIETLEGLRRGRKFKEIASLLGVHYYRVMKVAEHLSVNGDGEGWSEEELTEALRRLGWGEVNVKRGRTTYVNVLEDLIFSLMS